MRDVPLPEGLARGGSLMAGYQPKAPAPGRPLPPPLNPGPTSIRADVWPRERIERRAHALHAAVAYHTAGVPRRNSVLETADEFDAWLAKGPDQ
mgnify:CR=1 FL=1